MAIRLNHTIVAAHDKETAAKFLSEILGLPAPSLIDPFAVVRVSDNTSLDYIPPTARSRPSTTRSWWTRTNSTRSSSGIVNGT